MINKIGLSVIIVLLATGCTMTGSERKAYVSIGEKKYPVNESGKVVLTVKEIKNIQNMGTGTLATYKTDWGEMIVSGELILTPEEFAVLSLDRRALYSELDRKNPEGEIVFLVKSGKLKENIERILKEEGWEMLIWEADESLSVEKPFAVIAEDMESALIESMSDFPIFVTFDSTNKNVTITSKKI